MYCQSVFLYIICLCFSYYLFLISLNILVYLKKKKSLIFLKILLFFVYHFDLAPVVLVFVFCSIVECLFIEVKWSKIDQTNLVYKEPARG